jgi:hypothetical protein
MSEIIFQTILRLCSQKRSFNDLAERLDGLDPVVLLQILEDLSSKKLIKKIHTDDAWVITSYRNTRKKEEMSSNKNAVFRPITNPYFSFHKKPHPLDYEWRNSQNTLHILSESIAAYSSKDHILILGMPGLFMAAIQEKVTAQVTLIDSNKPLLEEIRPIIKTSNFSILAEDLFLTEPKNIKPATAVYIDPPWYTTQFMQFIWFASECLRIGGTLSISMPQLHTRPTLPQERRSWFKYCNELGLELLQLENKKMEYVMPFFEFNALRAAGIKNISPLWRKGDYVKFQKFENTTLERPNGDLVSSKWQEIEIDTVRFKVNLEDTQTEKFDIKHIVLGDILPTVSSRDERRTLANLWTSGNRIYHVSNPRMFLNYAHSYSNLNKIPSKQSIIAKEYIDYIIDIENKEYSNYLDWINYELETGYH